MLIGITCHVDTGGQEDLYPGTPLFYTEQNHSRVVIECGMTPVLIPVHEDEGYIDNILTKIDGLIASGGGKIRKSLLQGPVVPPLAETAPERYRFEKRLFAKALELDMPIIGTCRGAQMINEILGGTMVYNIPTEIENPLEHNQVNKNIPLEQPYHEIQIDPESKLYRLIGRERIAVNSYHRQAVKEPGKGLIVSARSDDGVVEALESTEHRFVILTQFHPEIMEKADPMWRCIYEEFKKHAADYANMKKK